MKRGFIILLLCIIVGSLLGIQSERLSPATAGGETLEAGDILFVDLYDGWCHGGYWDHLALYTGSQTVVEATFNGGICLTSLRVFYERDEPAVVSVRRLKDIPGRDDVIRTAVDYALKQVGKPFDFTATATIPAKINDENLHCTEVIWRSFKAAGIDVDGNGGPFLYPDDIYFSSKLEPA